jgi:hypothetical protein
MISIYHYLRRGPAEFEEITAALASEYTADQVKRALSSLSNRGFIQFNGVWKIILI